MEYTMDERCERIIKECLLLKTNNPIKIFRTIANKDYVRIHGPEHHILDGACILTAFYNDKGLDNLEKALEKLVAEGLRMPGATCGLWGVCGSVTSIGAALAIIDGTGPLSTDASWGKHMEFTSKALREMSKIGGPRCCKRDAFISLTEAIKFINENYNTSLPLTLFHCGYSRRNEQCIKERCSFFAEEN